MVSYRATYLPTDRATEWPRKEGSLISLKLCTLKVENKSMCAIFEFWWNNFLMGMKLNFKFESWGTFYKGVSCKKKKSKGFLCKMNPHQNYMEFFCKIFCWRSQIKLQGNSFIKWIGKIYKGFPCKKKLCGNSL